MDHCIELLKRIERSTRAEDVQSVLRHAAGARGYDRMVMFSVAAVPDPLVGRVYWMTDNWTDDGAVLDAHSYLLHCPVTQHILLREHPFFWTKQDNTGTAAYRIVDKPRGEGLHGLQVPVFGRTGLEGAVSLAGNRIDSSDDARWLLSCVSSEAFRVTRQLLQGDELIATGLLSPREKQVLQWIAAGRRQADIATTLGLSPRTVENHLRRARQRLGVATTAQALHLALRRGVIDA